MGIRRLGRALGRLLRAALLIWVATFVAVCLWTFLWPLDRAVPRGDVIVCLGGGINSDGTAGPGSHARAETCGALYRAGAAPLVIFTGGTGRSDLPSVASAMAAVADLPDHAVRIEESSRSTLQNALFSLPIIEDDARVILVTGAFHLPRSWASFRAMGAGPITLRASGTVRPNSDDMNGAAMMLAREALAIWFNAARYVAWRAAGPLGLPQDQRTALLH